MPIARVAPTDALSNATEETQIESAVSHPDQHQIEQADEKSTQSSMSNGVDRAANEPLVKATRSHSTVLLEVNRRVFNQKKFDAEFQFIPNKRTIWQTIAFKLKKSCTCRRKTILGFVPILEWLPKYNIRRNIVADLIAGLTIAVMHIPQAMAYATLAAMAPVYGLYTSFWSSIFYTFFGTSIHASMGTFAVVSLMIGNAITPLLNDIHQRTNATDLLTRSNDDEDRVVDQVIALSFLVGVIHILMGLLRLGFIAAYLSDQLIAGFTTGAAVHVFTSQINSILNVKLPRYTGVGSLFRTYYALGKDVIQGKSSYVTILMSLVTMTVLIIGKEYVNPPFKRRFKVPIPFEIIVVILGTVASYFLELNDRFDVKIVGKLERGMPTPRIPNFSLMPDYIGDAIGIAIVSFVISLSVGKLLAKKHGYRIDVAQEPYAYGFLNIGTSIMNGFVGCASLSRSVVLSSLEPETQMATFITAAMLLIVILFIGPLFNSLPNCVLASIILVALKGLFMQFGQLPKLYKIAKIDLCIWLVAFICTVVLGVRDGLLAAIGFALLTTVFRAQRPPAVVLGQVPGTDIYRNVVRYARCRQLADIKIFRFDSPLMFINAELFRNRLYAECEIDLAEARDLVNEEYHRRRSRCKSPESARKTSVKETKNSPDKQETLDNLRDSVLSIRRALRKTIPAFIIIDCSGFNYLDAQGLSTLFEVAEELHDIHIEVLFACMKAGPRVLLRVGGFHDSRNPVYVNEDKFFPSIHDAVTFAQYQLNTLLRPKTDRKLTMLNNAGDKIN